MGVRRSLGAAIVVAMTVVAGVLPVAAGAQTPSDAVLNEFVANHAGNDAAEFVEVAGPASTDMSNLTVLQIEGDGAGAGAVDSALTVGGTGAEGYWTTEFLSNELENGTITLLLVDGFTGSEGDDLDADNDGTAEVTPWTAVVDAVAVTDGGATDRTYADVVLAADFDGGSMTVGGASRIPDAADTGTVGDWTRNDFDGQGLPGLSGTIAPGEAVNTPGATNTTDFDDGVVLGECADPATPVHDVQGDGATSPLVGTRVVVEGVVVGDFQSGADGEDGDLGGFYVQEEDADADDLAATSEGVFVFDAAAQVAVGDVVRVLAGVVEFTTSGGSSMTELTTAEVLDCGEAALPAPTAVELPVDAPDAFEAYEGMRVVLPQDLRISEYFNYDRFGEIVLALPFGDPQLGGDRIFQPTAVVEPGDAAIALAERIALRRITLDDGLSAQNPQVTRHPNGDPFTLDNRFRGGDIVADATGVIDETFGLYRVQPTAPAEYTSTNRREAAPDVAGETDVASFNVLNYFLTLDQGADICGPAQDQECRGADTAEELGRQRAKILAALEAIDADVFGLIEMENTPGVSPLADIVAGLNAATAPGTYDYIDTGTIGTDAIKVGIIYRPGSVTPVGDHAILDSSVDPRFIDTKNRPALAQTFVDAAGGVFTVAVNHLKSKGSDCEDVDDPDTGDGQGNCNITRTMAAEALVDWLATDPTGSGDDDVLIIGDLNSYDKEDPIDAVREGADDTLGTADDYTDLLLDHEGELAYSYVFDGQLGYLDHALSTPTLTRQVADAATWHINADEPDLLDYDTSFKSDGQDALYEPDPYRSSDHDPVIVGMDLNASPVCDAAVATPDRLFPPNHRFVEIAVDGVTDAEGDSTTVTVDSIRTDEAVDAPDSGNTAPDGRGVGTSTAEVRAERVGEGNGRVYTIGFTATDTFGGSCTGQVTVGVPVGRRGDAVDDGPAYDATATP